MLEFVAYYLKIFRDILMNCSGMLAEHLGIRAEGVGSMTKRYFWINAFVREFIATIYEKKKTHLKVIGILFLINLISVVMMYISEIVFF